MLASRTDHSPRLVKCAPGGYRDLGKGAVPIVVIEEARRGVATHVDIGPAVIVKVGGRRAHAVGTGRPPILGHEGGEGGAMRIADAGLFGDVLEGAVAAIPVQQVRASSESLRSARHRDLAVAAVER